MFEVERLSWNVTIITNTYKLTFLYRFDLELKYYKEYIFKNSNFCNQSVSGAVRVVLYITFQLIVQQNNFINF